MPSNRGFEVDMPSNRGFEVGMPSNRGFEEEELIDISFGKAVGGGLINVGVIFLCLVLRLFCKYKFKDILNQLN
jgi:hypothetical protein